MVNAPIPTLEEYSISPRTGFLPDIPPLEILEDPYYEPWETAIERLHALILSRRVRQTVDGLPVLSTEYLKNENEWRRAYVILSFLSHSYIWGDETPSETLPRSISIPYLAVTAQLEVPPVASYAALCLWNFRPIFRNESFDSLENLATLHTFTGALDESWFYLVSVAIEARGAALLPLMLDTIQGARDYNIDSVVSHLQTFAERLGELTYLLGRMYENCDPYIFYTRIRPYLAGSKNMSEAGLPRGVKYLDGSGNEYFRHYSGGSNAQSSLIQAFDIFLGIEHRPTGSKKADQSAYGASPDSSTRTHNFILEMRDYMPGPHRRFLEHLSKVANINDFVNSNSSNGALTVAYDACLHMLRTFRDKHIQIVSRYIVIPAKEQRMGGERSIPGKRIGLTGSGISTHLSMDQPQRQGLARATKHKADLRGTGGTALIPFLKQARDETGDPSIGAWAHRLLTSGTASSLGSDVDNVKIQGLAGQWLDSEDVGGICHW
ncbi:Myoglobin [Dactylella cylindrospora]|nr:Myoglobin [Dactylella cylindrospora]